ncbi:MAG: hypothetical protein AAB388_03100 [Patescibacteria group bacterium]|mgnify:CR=1 FL=1
MEIKRTKYNRNAGGFALLITLVVVGVVLSVGLTLLDVSIKQVELSTNSRNSEIAFHAANAGLECARYWRRAAATAMENGQTIAPTCFGAMANAYSDATFFSDPVDGNVFQYDFEHTWGQTDQHCSRATILVASSSYNGAGISIPVATIKTVMPGYNKVTDPYVCQAGGRCTIMSIRGYNRACSLTTSYGTVEREVLLEF